MKNRILVLMTVFSMSVMMLAGCNGNVNVNVNIHEKSDEQVAASDEESDVIESENAVSDDATQAADDTEYVLTEDNEAELSKEAVVGKYINVRTEEIEGEELTIIDFILIQEDQRMFLRTQDLLTYEWYIDGENFVVENSPSTFRYDAEIDAIVAEWGSEHEEVFERADENDENYKNAFEDFMRMCREGIFYSTDMWLVRYNPYKLFAWVDETGESVTFSFCEEGVDISGSQTTTISYIADKSSKDVLEEIKLENDEEAAESIFTYFGSEGYPSYSYIVGSTKDDSEEEGVDIYNTYVAVEAEGGTILINSFSTLGNDEDVEMIVNSAFEEMLGTFELR